MSPAERLLATVTSAKWLGMNGEERAVVYDAIHEVVPARYQLASVVGHEPEALPFFIDQQTQLGFYLVFGQRFVMGASEADVAEGRRQQHEALQHDNWVDLEGWIVSPQRTVDAAPFFAGEAMLDEGRWIKIGVVRPTGQPMPDSAHQAFVSKGWRLPSEAELELVRQVAGRSNLERIDSGQCEDAWHDTYEGAPLDALPWGSSREVMRELDLYRLPPCRRQKGHRFKAYRPFFSLFPAEIGYSPEAIAARAAEPPMHFRW